MAVLEEFLAEVRPALPDSPLLLANAHKLVTTAHGGFGTEALATEVKWAADGAGVPRRHYPHRWRHSYATELVRAGVDIHVVQRLLGHRHIASTVGYTHLALDDLRSAIAAVWDDPAAGAAAGEADDGSSTATPDAGTPGEDSPVGARLRRHQGQLPSQERTRPETL